MRKYSVSLLVVVFLVAFSTSHAFAQHHGGQQAPPVSFGESQVTVDTSIIPPDFVPEKDSSANLKVRFFDTSSGLNIPNVTYRVQIFHGEQLLANQMYFDSDGELDIKIRPNSNCNEIDLWRCTSYEGKKDPMVPNAFASTDKSIPVMKGPVFNKGGIYTVKVAIIGAVTPKTQTTQEIKFETNITIAQEHQLSLSMSTGSVPILVRDYQDKSPMVILDESSGTIKMEMPFEWEHVIHTPMIRNEIILPKSFVMYGDITSFSGFVNGVQLLPKDLRFDKISDKDTNIIHVMINGEELELIKQKTSNSDTFSLVIVPNKEEFVSTSTVEFDNGYHAIASVDTRYSKSKDTSFSVSFYDSSGNLAKEVRYAYSVRNPSGHESVNMGGNPNKIGLNLVSGYDTQIIPTPEIGKYTIQIVLIGMGHEDFKNYIYRSIDFEMKEFTNTKIPSISNELKHINASSAVPNWIKNNAGWWADGKVDDNSFVQGIQYLIKQNIIKISKTQSNQTSSDIPSWVKNNAKWWADGKISEGDFLKGIEYLASIGIIRTE